MQQVLAFQDWLQRSEHPITFDPGYLAHLVQFHGGKPQKRVFKTATGKGHAIERFLHFLEDRNHPLAEYSVPATWSLIDNRLGLYLMPFAELFAGDFVCFDHEGSGRPSVVVWYHEKSREGKPYTEFVAANFDAFLQMIEEPAIS